jgi:nitrite reductase (cytochrome c-552)
VTVPWNNGTRADEILGYYEQAGFKDWTHAISQAPVLKAQHPEFEMYLQGIHARSGVTCADCHMPYLRQGAFKISDHWVRSPVLNLDAACRTCHHWAEDELRDRIYTIQDRTYQLRNLAIDAALDLATSIKSAGERGMSAERLARARTYHRRAQFLTDFVEAENSMGFHADQEAARVLGLAINYARLGTAELAGEPHAAGEPRLFEPPPQIVTPSGSGAEIYQSRRAVGLRPRVGSES